MITLNIANFKKIDIEFEKEYCINDAYITIAKSKKLYRLVEYTDMTFTIIYDIREFTNDAIRSILRNDFDIYVGKFIKS